MGKLQSKHGGAYTARVSICRETAGYVNLHQSRTKRKQELCGREFERERSLAYACPLEEREMESNNHMPFQTNGTWGGHPCRDVGKNTDEMRSNMSVTGNQQEWLFKLYALDDSGKVTKEDMSSLMHTIYEVLEMSVRKSSLRCTTLQMKLSITPADRDRREDEDPVFEKILQGGGRRDRACGRRRFHECCGSSERRQQSVDENKKRRSPYRDLAGTENYICRFDADSPSSEPKQGNAPHSAPSTHHSQTDFCGCSLSFLRALKGRSQAPECTGSPFKSRKDVVHHPPIRCQSPQQQQQLPQLSYNRHLGGNRVIEDSSPPLRGLHGYPLQFGPDGVPPSPSALPSGVFMPVTQRHKHHHHHEHHHHHHHYYQA
ncbi:naked cuticle-like protein 3 isoform X3 [Clupea harengus]|uniref:Protein naked cuticle homolog n=1 Tax=Clupea harengus TaxID=7950 RepID=A0A6P3W3D0_CLUHA|nr:naked cuticle-like protein 3 isoform X3 [Clupea harengus]